MSYRQGRLLYHCLVYNKPMVADLYLINSRQLKTIYFIPSTGEGNIFDKH